MFISLNWTCNGRSHYETIEINHIIDFGRSATSYIQLDDKTVSRRHALIYPYKRSLFLQNVSKTNQIWVDHRHPLHKGEAVMLKAGETFNIGRIRFTITAIDTAANSFTKHWGRPNQTQTLQTPQAFTPAPC